jgi:hypothetical protein
MEMPPLFSNGVIGQTTSHLVSRETDLSLNSLLSRSQSIFGHAAKSIGFVNYKFIIQNWNSFSTIVYVALRTYDSELSLVVSTVKTNQD